MPRAMRRKDKALGSADAERILKVGEFGVLSTSSANGWPYGVPVSFVYSGGSIYFHSARVGRKLINIRHDDRVSFCVVGRNRVRRREFSVLYESVIVSGRASAVTGEEKRMALLLLAEKYVDLPHSDIISYVERHRAEASVVRIDPDGTTAKGDLGEDHEPQDLV
jgi:nitroimidazol reductase NimA-like FMN-containing flavoprotein (pyridoxamine 5'-phosphate oxidase superfamily)